MSHLGCCSGWRTGLSALPLPSAVDSPYSGQRDPVKHHLNQGTPLLKTLQETFHLIQKESESLLKAPANRQAHYNPHSLPCHFPHVSWSPPLLQQSWPAHPSVSTPGTTLPQHLDNCSFLRPFPSNSMALSHFSENFCSNVNEPFISTLFHNVTQLNNTPFPDFSSQYCSITCTHSTHLFYYRYLHTRTQAHESKVLCFVNCCIPNV